MINKQKLLSIAVAVLTLFCMTSCKDETEPVPANYERPVVTVSRAIVANDTKAYLNSFTDGAKNAYVKGDNYNKDLVKTFLPSQSESIMKTKTLSDSELDENAIDKLKQQYKEKYKKRIDITKARKLKVEFDLQGAAQMKATKELTVVRVENSWLIFGDVIEDFEFKKA